jgi:hypothetical protein
VIPGEPKARDDRGAEGLRSDEGTGRAEEVLLADALAVRLILARMEQAVQHGVRERLP